MKLSWVNKSIVFILVCYLFAWIIGYQVRHNIISYDVSNYYGYLPAILQYQDLRFKFLQKIPEENLQYISISKNKSPDGKNTRNKMSMGLAYLYLPFYALAYLTAPIFSPGTHSFSNHYGIFILLGGLFYGVIGLWILSKVLRNYFEDKTVAMLLVSIAFASNFFNYSVAEGGMSHVYNFFLFSLVLFLTIQYYKRPKLIAATILGALLGLIILIRPTNVVVLIPLLLWEIKNIKSIRDRFRFLGQHYIHLIIAGLTGLLVIIPQLYYWKIITGSWIYYSYQSEGFNFLSPELINGIFSYRKGWLIYTPVMFFALAGFFFLRDTKTKGLIMPVLSFMIINLYVVFSWHSWWYGGGFGARALVESYVFLAFPLSAFYKKLLSKPLPFRLCLFILIVLFSLLNLFQTYQYARGILSNDSMTKEVYWDILGKIHPE